VWAGPQLALGSAGLPALPALAGAFPGRQVGLPKCKAGQALSHGQLLPLRGGEVRAGQEQPAAGHWTRAAPGGQAAAAPQR
jgi:hypothetical protein